MKTFLFLGINCYPGTKHRLHHICRCFKEDGWRVLFIQPVEMEGFVKYDGIYTASVVESPFTKMGRGALRSDYSWEHIKNWIGVGSELVIWIQSPIWLPFVEILKSYYKGIKVIYDINDYFWGFRVLSPYRDVLEPMHNQFIQLSDHVVGSSKYLIDSIPNSILIKNACWFEEWGVPLTPEKPPIVGYCGTISDWFDTELALEIVKAGYRLELVGALHSPLAEKLESYYLGESNYRELPPILQRWSCGLILHQHNQLTDGADCIKTYEYHAMGLPVIGQPTVSNLYQQKDGSLIRVADSKTFILAIAEELVSDSPERYILRKKWAKKNTWKCRFQQIKEML